MRSRLIAKLNNELCLISSELSPSVSASEIWEPVGNLIASVYKFYLFQEDRLAHEILFSALKAASVSSQAPEALYHLLKKAFETIHTLVVDIAKGENIEDLVEKWLPALIGMLKALSDSCLLMSPETFLLSWNSLQTLTNEDLLDQLSDCLNNLNVNPELTPYRRRLSRNSFDRHPFSPEVLQLRCVTFLRNSIAVYLYNSIPCNESTPTPFYSKKTESTNTHLSIINNSISPFQSASNTPSFHPLRTSLQFNKIWSSLCQIKNHLSPFNAVFPVDELNAFVNYAYENLLAKLRQFHPSHSIPTVILYLQTSTLAWTLSSLPFDPLVKSIFSVFDIEKNPSIDCIPLFEVAASCLILISFTATCPTSLKTKIHNFSLDLLTVPHTAFSLGTAPSISKLRLALSQVLAATCHFLPQLSSSAIYSLIRNASGKLNQVQFENCCTALAVMACELQTPSILDTVLPFFMRTLSSTPNLASMSTMTVSSILTDSGGNSSLNQLKSEATDSSAPNLNANMPNSLFKMSFSSFDTSNCLRYLVNIALDAPLKNFLEVIPFFSEYARQHIGNGPISEIIVECVYRMEERASHTKKRVVLHVLLSFFIDKAAYQLIHGNTNLDELGKLLQLISKVCSVIESQKRHSILEALSNLDTKEDSETSSPKSDSTLEMNLANGSALKPFEKKFRQKLEASQKYASSRLILPSAASFLPLFRSLWYFIVIFDMLSNETMLDTVVDIAAQTPKLAFTLVPENYFQTPAHKTRLLQLLPSCAHLINPLSTEECLYLLTQYHIMCCTASDAELHVFCHLEDMVQYKTMFPVFIPLVELVMSQFFFHKKASKQLSTMIGQLLSGIEYPHPQISSTCLSLLRKLFQKHAYLLYEKEFFTMTLECALKTPEKSLLIDLKKWIQTAYINSVVVLLSVYIIENEEFETSTFISCLTSQPQLLNKFHWTLSKLSACMAQIEALNVQNLHNEVKHFPTPSSLFKLAVALIRMNGFDRTFFKSLISLPFAHFNLEFLKSGTIAWHTLLYFQHGSEFQFLILLERNWQRQLLGKLGLYNTVFPILDPLRDKVQYSVHKSESSTSLLQELECMCYLIEFLEHLLGTVEELPDNYFQILQSSLSHEMMTSHEASRTARFLLLSLVLQASQHDSCTPAHSKLLIEKAFNCSLKWFTFAPQLACHSPQNVLGALKKFWGLAQKILQPQFTSDFPLLTLLIASESEQIRCWCDLEVSMDILPPQPTSSAAYWKNMVRIAFQYHPSIAVHLLTRFPAHSHLIQPELQIHVKQNANSSTLHACPLGLFSLLTEENLNNDIDELLYIIYWDPLPPIQAMTLFQAKYKYHPLVIQYAFRSLFSVPIQSVLFYIPQLVQLLRHDPLGYVMEYILHAAKTSPIFAHQIIWNMKANMYHDEAGNEPDPLKPLFEELIDRIIQSFTPEDLSYYHREFDFFNKITSISGKLKPYIKKPKSEKKKKIDEELAFIKVDVGCYLPSNPESTVIDIDYNSGKPLQSHAKAPFLATFKIEREINGLKEQVWQSAIFKVGDDCRQDVLALQLIALFKSIFKAVQLDLYLFPYRVVATAPGCGVIEVIPNAMSRDMLGREKINSLHDYFVWKYGLPHTPKFRKAQMNFIQSVAGYSVIVYLLQIKDRHNGNIMIDDQGHLVHIDFGFILDISPGGINFESSPFKLTSEMLQVIQPIGSESFNLFRQLVVKAFLAVRPYAEEIVNLVQLMAESGLPCFKSEQTLKKLRSRFVLDRNQREAAAYMTDRINDSYKNWRTVAYDKFQNMQSGIPF